MSLLTASSQSYHLGAYTIFNNDWGATGLVIGENFTQQISFNNSDINNDVVMSWSYPDVQGVDGVYGYPEVIWGAQYGGFGPGTTSFANPISNIRSLLVNYSTSISGQTNLFDVGIEIWTTNEPPSQAGAVITSEIMVKVHGWSPNGLSDGPGTTYDDNQIGLSGSGTAVEAIHYNSGGAPKHTFVTIDTTSDMLSGQINFAPILDSLVAEGVISSNDYVSGVELGSEMLWGSGSLTVNNFSVAEEVGLVTPTISSVTAATDNHATNVSAGHVVMITVATNEAVTVTGAPTLQLNDNEVAAYTSGSGTNALTFTYVVQPFDNVTDLQVTGLNLPSGTTIQDLAGNNLSGSVTGDLGLSVAGKLTPATVAQEINGLYVTLYGLAATQAGITYWENVVQSFDPSVTAANAATTAISVSDQTYLGEQMTAGSPIVNGTTYFATLYPASMSDMTFVQALYQNMSNFIGTVAGDNYWFNLLQQAEASNGGNVIAARESIAGQFVHDFLSNDLTVGAAALGVSQSDYTLLVNGQQALLNKASVSQYYANETAASGGSIINYTAVTDPAFTAAHNVAAAITSDPSTVTAAIIGINNAIAHQNLSLI